MHDSTIGFSKSATPAPGIAPMSEPNVTYHDILAANYTVTGIRQDGGTGRPVVITGSYQSSAGAAPKALLYRGPIYPTDSSGYAFLKPSIDGRTATSSVFYGPNTPLFDPGIGAGNVRAVGSYKFAEGGKLDHGMMYEGPWDGLGTWTPIDVPDDLVSGAVANTIAHSTMGDLVVGNYDIAGKPGSGNGFIYNIKTKTYTLLSIGELATAYGIWQNGDSTSSSYTIAGGYKGGNGLNVGFLVNYDSSTGRFSGLSDFNYDNNPGIVTHFEGITGIPGGYTLAATGDYGAAFAAIASNGNGKFGVPRWVAIDYKASVGICTGNSILDNNLIGIYQPAAGGVQSYLATVSGLSAAQRGDA
jgi:hypothetical protein